MLRKLSAALLALSLGLTSSALASSPTKPRAFGATVVRVSDGDTVVVRGAKYNDQLRVRMHNIDTPETHLPVPGGMASQGYWGEAATAYLQKLLPIGAKVTLVTYGTDKYDRVIGKIIYNNQDINLMMAASGWAVPYAICDVGQCDANYLKTLDIPRYLAACQYARKNGLGIFNPQRPLKEMPFEFRLRKMKRNPDKFVVDVFKGKVFEPHNYKKVDLCDRVQFMSGEDAVKLGYKPSR